MSKREASLGMVGDLESIKEAYVGLNGKSRGFSRW